MKKKTSKSKKKKTSKKADTEVSLTLKMENFCYYYLFGGYIKNSRGKEIYFKLGNATMSYCKAYQLDCDDENKYNIASVEGKSNLRKPSIRERMKQMLNDEGLNDEVVDARLLDIIKNSSAQHANVAIKEYNTLKKRIDNSANVVVINTDKKQVFNKALEYLKKK